jgi:hypothetical protein
MPKLALRFFMLSMTTLALMVGPTVTKAEAATTSHKHVKKHARVVQQGPRAKDPGANPFASSYQDDEDRRRASSGGGGY